MNLYVSKVAGLDAAQADRLWGWMQQVMVRLSPGPVMGRMGSDRPWAQADTALETALRQTIASSVIPGDRVRWSPVHLQLLPDQARLWPAAPLSQALNQALAEFLTEDGWQVLGHMGGAFGGLEARHDRLQGLPTLALQSAWGRNIQGWLRDGFGDHPHGAWMRRTQNEIQMFMHEHRLSVETQAAEGTEDGADADADGGMAKAGAALPSANALWPHWSGACWTAFAPPDLEILCLDAPDLSRPGSESWTQVERLIHTAPGQVQSVVLCGEQHWQHWQLWTASDPGAASGWRQYWSFLTGASSRPQAHSAAQARRRPPATWEQLWQDLSAQAKDGSP